MTPTDTIDVMGMTTQKQRAEAWLKAHLDGRGWLYSADIKQAAQAVGIADPTLLRAATTLKVEMTSTTRPELGRQGLRVTAWRL